MAESFDWHLILKNIDAKHHTMIELILSNWVGHLQETPFFKADLFLIKIPAEFMMIKCNEGRTYLAVLLNLHEPTLHFNQQTPTITAM